MGNPGISHARLWRCCARTGITLLILGAGMNARAQDIPTLASPTDEAKRAVRARDYTLAVTLYSGLANQGDIDALYQLGALYETGKGVTKDYPAAFSWYKKAAEKGSAKAQFNVASMLESGRGVLQDIPEALSWFINRIWKDGALPLLKKSGRTKQSQSPRPK